MDAKRIVPLPDPNSLMLSRYRVPTPSYNRNGGARPVLPRGSPDYRCNRTDIILR